MTPDFQDHLLEVFLPDPRVNEDDDKKEDCSLQGMRVPVAGENENNSTDHAKTISRQVANH